MSLRARAGVGVRSATPHISAVILAAGESSRMGTSKPLLEIGGRSLLALTLDAVRGAGIAEVVVVLGNEADRVRESVPLAGARVVVNHAYKDGLSTSLRAGLRACEPDVEACLVVLADQPFLREDTVKALLEGYRRSRAMITVPTYHRRRGNPVLLQKSVWPEVEQLSGDVGFRAVFGMHAGSLRELPVDDPGVLIDIDTPVDLERVRRALENHEPLESLV